MLVDPRLVIFIVATQNRLFITRGIFIFSIVSSNLKESRTPPKKFPILLQHGHDFANDGSKMGKNIGFISPAVGIISINVIFL